METLKLKDLVAPGMTATFVSARRGDLIYRIGTFSFAVPIVDMGDGEFLPEDKAKIKQCETLAAYHVEAANCYRRGAESPWLPIWLPKAPAETPP